MEGRRQQPKRLSADIGGEGWQVWGLGWCLLPLLVEVEGVPRHSALPSPPLCSLPREVFEPTVERGELVVRYRVRKSYSRRTTEATCK